MYVRKSVEDEGLADPTQYIYSCSGSPGELIEPISLSICLSVRLNVEKSAIWKSSDTKFGMKALVNHTQNSFFQKLAPKHTHPFVMWYTYYLYHFNGINLLKHIKQLKNKLYKHYLAIISLAINTNFKIENLKYKKVSVILLRIPKFPLVLGQLSTWELIWFNNWITWHNPTHLHCATLVTVAKSRNNAENNMGSGGGDT